MKKSQITIDLTKLDKTKIIDREYTAKDGTVIKQKLYKLDAVPLKQIKFIKEGDTWVLNKVGFLAEPQTPEQRENKVSVIILGDITEFNERPKQPSGDYYPMDDNNALGSMDSGDTPL